MVIASKTIFGLSSGIYKLQWGRRVPCWKTTNSSRILAKKTPSRAVTRQTKKKMVLKDIVCEYGLDGNGGRWYCFFELCFSYIMIGVCVLAAVSWFYSTLIFRPTRVLSLSLQNAATRKIRVSPAHGSGTPPVDDVTMSETGRIAENAMQSHRTFLFSCEIKLFISTHYEMTRKLEVRMTQGLRRSAV